MEEEEVALHKRANIERCVFSRDEANLLLNAGGKRSMFPKIERPCYAQYEIVSGMYRANGIGYDS